MASELEDFITYLEDVGFYDVALPFMLVFTLFFAILQKVKIFGENSKNFNAVIALVAAFLVVRTDAVVQVMNEFLPSVSLLVIVFIVILMLIGLFLGKQQTWTGWPLYLAIITSVAGVIWAFWGSSGALALQLPDWLQVTREDRNLFIGIALFFIFFFIVTADSSKDKGLIDRIFDKNGPSLAELLTGGKKS